MTELTEKQQRVLDAAMDVFAERGFAAASTAEIAKRAGVAEGTVFKTYKTKKDLLIAVVAPFFARTIAPVLLEDVRTIIRHPHARFEDFVRAIYRDRLAFIHAHLRVVRIALQELPFHGEVRALAKQTILERVWPDVEAMVKRFQKMGELRADVEPSQVVRLVAGTMASYAIARFVVAPDKRWDDEAEIELMVTTLARGLGESVR